MNRPLKSAAKSPPRVDKRPADPTGQSWVVTVIGVAGIVGSPGLIAFGTSTRYALILTGIAILVVHCILVAVKNPRTCVQVFYFLCICACIEYYQFVREHQVFTLAKAVLRATCYLALLSGWLSSQAFRSPWSWIREGRLDKILLLFVTLLSMGYLTAARTQKTLIDQAGGMTGGRFSADEALNPVGLAYVFGSFMVISAYYALSLKQRFWSLAALFSLALSFYCALSTGSRGGALSASVAVLATIGLLSVLGTRLTKRVVIRVILVGLALPGLLGAFLATELEFLTHRFQRLGEGDDASMIEREYIWDYYKMNFDHWFVWGMKGYGGPYPHNVFFELWVRFGIFGLLAALLLCALVFFFVKSTISLKKPTLVLMFALFLFNLTNAQSNLSLEMNRWLFLGVGAGAGVLYRSALATRLPSPGRAIRKFRNT